MNNTVKILITSLNVCAKSVKLKELICTKTFPKTNNGLLTLTLTVKQLQRYLNFAPITMVGGVASTQVVTRDLAAWLGPVHNPLYRPSPSSLQHSVFPAGCLRHPLRATTTIFPD